MTEEERDISTAEEPRDDDGAHATRLWTPLFVLIILASLCTFMVSQGLNSGTSVYLSLKGQNATAAGIGAAVFSVMAGIMRIAIGPVLDERGRFPVLVGGLAVLLLGTLLCAFNSGIAFMTVCRAIQGAGFAMATTAGGTMAADISPFDRLGEGIGYYGLGQAIAMSMGPAFALFLVGTDPAENLYFGLTLLACVAIACALACNYEKRPERLSEQATYRIRVKERAEKQQKNPSAVKPRLIERVFERSALRGAVPLLIISPVFGFFIYFGGLYGTVLGVGNAGLMYTLMAVSMIGIRVFSKSFMDSVDPKKLETVGVVCAVAGLLLLMAADGFGTGKTHPALFYLGGLVFGGCNGMCIPVCTSVAVKCTRPERWGAANALTMLAPDIGIGISCVIWGITNDCLGYPVTLALCIACAIVSLATTYALFPKEAR